MKTNFSLIILLIIALTFEFILNNFMYGNSEYQLIFDLTVVFYSVNKNLLLKEKTYQKGIYFLNSNSFIILIFLYIEGIFSTNNFIINTIFLFILPFIVLQDDFPDKISISYISILIIYVTSFFIIKDYIIVSIYSGYEFYLNILFISKMFINITLNILIIIFLRLVFSNSLEIRKKS